MPDLKIFAKTVEQEAIDQVHLLLEQPAFKDCKVRIMPDTHAGKGCVIGFTANLGDKVIPNIVGVDIGCGMLTVELGDINIDFAALDKIIRKYVPCGKNVHSHHVQNFPELYNLKCITAIKNDKRLQQSVGTLGGGNHFLEVDVDEDNNKYLIIHTGSRNLGKQVAVHYQKLAFDRRMGDDIRFLKKKEKLLSSLKKNQQHDKIPAELAALNEEFSVPLIPKELCYLTGKDRENYLHDMKICQEFATMNRNIIAAIILSRMDWTSSKSYHTVHNYINYESNIVRKGAISAEKGETLLIPINMRDGCILGIGKGNEDWNYSAPHGAGRLMSRTKAKQELSMDEYTDTMKNIFTTSVSKSTLDEAPMAYKSMQEIIDTIKDTVDILKILKPIYNFKAND